MSIDVDTVSDLIRDVSARVIDPRFRTLHDHQIHQKKPGDFVTDADRQAECELGAAVTKYAGGIVVGEESAFADPTILDAVSDADLAWVIDPIDGTKNFVHGSVDHGVMLAQLSRGETVRGWIWQPQYGHMWFAEHGAGVTCDGDEVTRGIPTLRFVLPPPMRSTRFPRLWWNGEWRNGAVRWIIRWCARTRTMSPSINTLTRGITFLARSWYERSAE